jgi:hypothetical protein
MLSKDILNYSSKTAQSKKHLPSGSIWVYITNFCIKPHCYKLSRNTYSYKVMGNYLVVGTEISFQWKSEVYWDSVLRSAWHLSLHPTEFYAWMRDGWRDWWYSDIFLYCCLVKECHHKGCI